MCYVVAMWHTWDAGRRRENIENTIPSFVSPLVIVTALRSPSSHLSIDCLRAAQTFETRLVVAEDFKRKRNSRNARDKHSSIGGRECCVCVCWCTTTTRKCPYMEFLSDGFHSSARGASQVRVFSEFLAVP